MGVLPGLLRFGIGATGVAAVGSLVLNATAQHRDRLDSERAERNKGLHPRDQERPSDDVVDNIDGLLRLTAGAGAVVAGAVAGVAALRGAHFIAALMAGVALGLAGSALLAGTGPLNTRVSRNVKSAGDFISARVHASMDLNPAKFSKQLPLDSRASSRVEPKPTAQEVLDAKIKLMPGKPDMEVAQREAQKTIDAIDWSKPDILMWIPGTYTHNAANNWNNFGAKTLEGRGSVVMLDYPATLDFDSSASTGMEALRLVLAEVARRGGEHRVMLGGHSQGAWIIGDAMATPELRAMIDRAALFGHPGLAKRHYDDRQDPKVVELNNDKDPIAAKVVDRAEFVDAMGALEQGITPVTAPKVISSALRNPAASAYWVVAAMDPERWVHADPHTYYGAYRDAISWLDTGQLKRKS
ncbi:MAG: Cutinase [Thermoleophilia bacterium]|jgi:hypothetical protein|nr:Cutinase [Thermoleophilia bacterium]